MWLHSSQHLESHPLPIRGTIGAGHGLVLAARGRPDDNADEPCSKLGSDPCGELAASVNAPRAVSTSV